MLKRTINREIIRTDVGGKEINEGDIVRFEHSTSYGFLGTDSGMGVCAVEWDEKKEEWGPWSSFSENKLKNIKIIGHIDKNPEMLEQKNWPECPENRKTCDLFSGEQCLRIEGEDCPLEESK
ncbi:hypothetical protein KAR91_28255 [Candidatus Pacearchaeota archaeon]|nr:hypothetical protein [Candidatus Pacearchaeota archaeon]